MFTFFVLFVYIVENQTSAMIVSLLKPLALSHLQPFLTFAP